MVSLTMSVKLARDYFRLSIDETVPLAGTLGILGPSGAGKTTLLRLLAGLDCPDDGRIAVGTTTWFDGEQGVYCPPHKRGVGHVFQDARLFPHLSVAGNLRFAEQRRGGRRPLDLDISGMLGLVPLMHRMPHTLSGGERQRVALGRTLLNAPEFLLLDEPFSAIDGEHRLEILSLMRDMIAATGLPTIVVSHNLSELSYLADRLWVLRSGQVVAQGPVADVMNRLDLQEVSAQADAGSVLQATVRDHDPHYQLTRLVCAGEMLTVAGVIGSRGDLMRVRVYARDVALALTKPVDSSIRNVLPTELRAIVQLPGTPYVDVLLGVGDTALRARITKASADDLGLETGARAYALLKAVSVETA